ncbi:alpha/beta hydrolase family protein [Sessilibacter sp. MAH4]
MKKTLPYGSWPSKISAQHIVSQSLGLAEPKWDGEDLYWLEFRPNEKGRNCIVKKDGNGNISDVIPENMSSRSKANEYGGGSYTVANHIVYFVSGYDQRIYKVDTQTQPIQATAITAEGPYRYADLLIDSHKNRIICIREDHSHKSADDQSHHIEEKAELVAVDCNTGETTVLATGDDFYASPNLSLDGNQLVWISWNHPAMPWESNSVFTAIINSQGTLDDITAIAGVAAGEAPQSHFQPQWSATNTVISICDRDNWWHFYEYKQQNWQPLLKAELNFADAEFATPQWVFGLSTWGFIDVETIACCFNIRNIWQLALINYQTGDCNVIESDCSDIANMAVSNNKFAFIGSNAATPSELAIIDLNSENEDELIFEIVKSIPTDLQEDVFSIPEAIEFGPEGEQAHGFYYPPHNTEYCAADGEKPPLIVMAHGGPTSARSTAFNIKIQYWCSRGFAVVDVNYRGSTGYGRDYRLALNHNWGVKDVEDVCRAANYLVEKGLADANKLAIKGGSAGGYTVLAALTFESTFKAGASHYGIGDLETLATDTHKFESRYLDSLIGKYPEDQSTYVSRSPINHVERLDCPVIFFQGGQDKVVPPNQAEAMVNALNAKEIPVAYVLFPEEGHGFRQANNMIRSVEGELYFYSKIFGFELSEKIEAVEIQNLSI